MEIDHDEMSVKQSNTMDYAAKLEAMLCDDEEPDTEFPPLTPPKKVSKCINCQNTSKKLTDSESNSDTPEQQLKHDKTNNKRQKKLTKC